MAQGVSETPQQVTRPASALRLVRVARGLTQGQLADRAGLARPTISRLENAHEEPQHRTAQRLAAVLGWDAAALFPDLARDGSE